MTIRLPVALVLLVALACVSLGAAGWMTNVTTALMTGTNNDWHSYTLVSRFEAAQLANPGGSLVRVTLRGGSPQAGTVEAIYIGHAAASGDAYDFAATPVQLFCSASATCSAPSNTDLVTDSAAFTWDGTSAIIVSYQVEGSGSDDLAASIAITGWSTYERGSVDQAATVDKSSYVSVAFPVYIKTIESFIPGGAPSMLTLGVR